MIKKAKDNNNFILSEKPFPTYIYEPSAAMKNDRFAKKDMETYYEKAYNLVDEANDDLRDFANNTASDYETKENSYDLDLSRDLFTIYIKDGYKYGFSMILEFDDLFIDGISKEDKSRLENSIKSYAIALMKDVASKTKMTLFGEKTVDLKTVDEDIEDLQSLKNQVKDLDVELKKATSEEDQKTWYKLMGERNNLVRKIMKLEKNKAQDSADLQIKIEIDESLAKELIRNVECDGKNITFKLEGGDFTIVHSDPIHDYFGDYDPDTFDSDEFKERIQPDGDLHQEVIDELTGEDALLMIWL